MKRVAIAAFALLLAGQGCVADGESKLGVTHGPAYYNKANLRLGGVDHITRLGETCGFADAAYQTMAIKHVNQRDSSWCKAIGDLSTGWDMSLVLMDATEQAADPNSPPPKAALSAGLKLVGSGPDSPAPLMSWVGTDRAPWTESDFNGSSRDILPVHGLVGPSYSGTTMKTFSFFASFDVPIMSNYATNPAMTQKTGNSGYPNFWRTCPPDSLKMDLIAAWLQSWSISKVFVTTIDDSFPIGMRDAFLGYCPNYGLTCVTASSLVPASTDAQTDDVLDTLMAEYKASGSRTIVLSGLVAQNANIMRKLVAEGLANGDEGYIVVHPELIGDSEVDFDGAFAVLPDHQIIPAWEAAYDMRPPLEDIVKPFVNGGGFANDSFIYTALEQSPLCGVEQDVVCNSTSIGYNGMMGDVNSSRENDPHYTWHEVKDKFDSCSAYGPLGYDSVVSYAAAFDIGVRLHTAGHAQGFDKDSVTPAKLMEMLNILTQGVDADGNAVVLDKNGTDTPVKEFYSTCIGSGGPIGFEWRDGMRQERSSHFSVVNYRKISEDATELKGHPTWDMFSAVPGAPVQRDEDAVASAKFGTGETLGYNPSVHTGMPPTCPPGQYLHPDTGCTDTSPGYYQPEAGQDRQLACPAGKKCESGGCADQCDPCAPGTFQDQTGQANCTKCPVGYAAGSPGSVACSPCQPGEFAAQEGMDSCAACAIGTAQPDVGQASCDPCPSGRTTFEKGASLNASCLCVEGTMEPTDWRAVADVVNGTIQGLADVADALDVAMIDLPICQACPEGFTCPLGSTFYDAFGENHVLHGYEEPDADLVIVPVSRPNMGVSEGYYLAADYQNSAGSEADKLAQNIYLCDGLGIQVLSQEGYVSPCPGGPADACDNGREGIGCAKCAAGSFTTVDGPCAECDGWEPAILICVILAGFTAVVASYYFINGPLNGKLSPLMVLAMCAGTFVMTMQSCAALASLPISFPTGLEGLFAGTRLFALDLRVLRPECSLGSSVIASYALKVGLPWFLFALFGVLCLLSQFAPERLRWEKSKTFNTVCNFFQAAFITIILTVVGPFRTFAHPGLGDRSSMLSSVDIDTSSGTYAWLIVFAVLGLLPCALFIALYVSTVKRSPSWRGRASKVENLQAIKFVLFRFEAHAYYWGLCFLARSTAVAIITLLNNAFSQLLLLSIVMVVYLVALCLVWPWKAPVVNWLDALQTTLLIVILLAATRLVGTDHGGEDAGAVTGLITTCYVLLALAFLVAGALAVSGKIDLGDRTDQEADKIPADESAEGSADAKIDGDKVDETPGDKAEIVVHLAEDEAARAEGAEDSNDVAEGAEDAEVNRV